MQKKAPFNPFYKIDPEDVTIINSVDDLLVTLDEIRKEFIESDDFDFVIFRGQNVDEPLWPRIARKGYLGTEQLKTEYRIFEDFKRMSLPYISHPNLSDWDILSIAQHHGLPTRLLDWTENILIAIWFAIRQRPSENAVVWTFGFNGDDILKPNDLNIFSDKTRVFQPRHTNSRVTSQMGWFTSHYYNSKDNIYTALNRNPTYRKRLAKIKFKPENPIEFRIELLDVLESYGVHDYSVFPDLDGLSKFLEYKHFKTPKVSLLNP